MSCIKHSAVSRHWLFGVKKWCYYRRTFLCQAVCKHLIANSPCAQRACGVNRQGVRWEKELRLNKRDGSKYLARASVIFCFVWVFLVCFVMGVSSMTRGPKLRSRKRKKSKWNLEKQLWGHGFLAQGANSGTTLPEVRRRQRAGAEGEEGVEEGSRHGWSDSGDRPGVKRGTETGACSGWPRGTEVVWTCGTVGAGGRGRKREKRRWGWVWSRSGGAGVDGSFPHCAGLRFSGVLCWRQGTTFYL